VSQGCKLLLIASVKPLGFRTGSTIRWLRKVVRQLPHPLGLFGALGTRYKVRNSLPKVGIPDVVLWPELAPFLLMPESQAVEALAEYIVWQECPSEARVGWLRESINEALRQEPVSEDSPRAWASHAFFNSVAWCELLDPDVHNQLSLEVSDLFG